MDPKQLPASAATDKLMAERFLPTGSWYASSARSDHVISYGGTAWMPSSDIKDALSLLPYVTAKGCDFWMDAWKDGTFSAGVSMPDGRTTGHCEADTLPLAICRALLSMPT